MKRKLLAILPLAAGISYLAIHPAALYGLFGLGDVVFDPTSYATLGHIWSEDISNGAKLAETYNQTVKIVQNGVALYTLAREMSQRVQNKEVWRMATFAAGNELAHAHYNETINFNAVMNGDVLNAGRAWRESTRDAGQGGYLGRATPATSHRMAEFATIQLLDQTSERCAAILANYKSRQDANQVAEAKLSSDTFDGTDASNSMVAVLNVLSGGHIQAQTQAKANGNLQACLAEQQTLQAKVERDRLAEEQNWYASIAAARASSPALLDPTLTAATASHYLEP